MIKKAALKTIRIYQATLSPDHGWFKHRHPYGYCRFYPSCSEYSYRVIDERGLIVGTGLSLVRIVKCNPLSTPRIDESYKRGYKKAHKNQKTHKNTSSRKATT